MPRFDIRSDYDHVWEIANDFDHACGNKYILTECVGIGFIKTARRETKLISNETDFNLACRKITNFYYHVENDNDFYRACRNKTQLHRGWGNDSDLDRAAGNKSGVNHAHENVTAFDCIWWNVTGF